MPNGFRGGLPAEYDFRSRIRKSHQMNASDPVSCLLNYSYAILESQCRKALNSAGLEPTIGFLHETRQTKSSLCYDTMEIFRWVVDTTIMESLENREFKKSDFYRTDNYVLRLKPESVKRLLSRLREKFNSTVNYRGKAYRWDTIVFLKAQELAKHILDGKPIDFSEPSPNLGRSDTQELRKRILSLSQSEAKKLGIGKSTLHYLRKHVTGEKSFDVYQKVARKLETS